VEVNKKKETKKEKKEKQWINRGETPRAETHVKIYELQRRSVLGLLFKR
jgi:hypothetical protein